jgi:hypothetical protein
LPTIRAGGSTSRRGRSSRCMAEHRSGSGPGGYYTQAQYDLCMQQAVSRSCRRSTCRGTRTRRSRAPRLNCNGTAPDLYQASRRLQRAVRGPRRHLQFIDDVVREIAAITPTLFPRWRRRGEDVTRSIPRSSLACRGSSGRTARR